MERLLNTYPSIFTLKRTVRVILIDPQYKDANARFTTVLQQYLFLFYFITK